MKKAFIHISDLHVAAKNTPGGEDNSNRANKTWLVAQSDRDNHYYIKEFCSYVKEKCHEYELYLIISGDIADSSEKAEYDCASTFLKQIMSELNISKEKVLLVPGNHDVNRYECEHAVRKDNTKDAYTFNSEKYIYFSEFYDNLLGKSFLVDNAVVDYMAVDDEKLLFVGVNTNYKLGTRDGFGAVDLERFNEEMKNVQSKCPDYIKIAVFHHNIFSNYEKSTSPYGSWLKDDWLNFKESLESFNFKCVLFGNEHTRSSDHNYKMEMFYSDAGSFALKEPSPSFKIYCVEKNSTKTLLKQSLFMLSNANKKGDRIYGTWVEQNIHDIKEIEEFVLCEKANLSSETCDPLPNKANGHLDNTSQNTFDNVSPIQTNPQFHTSLLEIIKKDNLFHQGHFHWGEKSRSLNWIDTISLLSNREYFKLIKNELNRFIDSNKIEYDFVLGIGIEGNILSAPLFSSNRPYTYLPYTYRYNEANDCEKSMCVTNGGRYKKILVVTDVVHQGRMLRNLFEEKEKVFFAEVEQINILSLFYTGKEDDILDDLPEGLRELKGKVKFYALMELKVGKCPYQQDYANKCANYEHRLCEVYKFYNEK